eukprot:GDKI01001402.1.p1 GENE.GDKI01001402.1~~GDKI01001402.1.p1  ORF type:complete len:227 (+),score=11.34 GDKI01001402.1:229-909(+)
MDYDDFPDDIAEEWDEFDHQSDDFSDSEIAQIEDGTLRFLACLPCPLLKNSHLNLYLNASHSKNVYAIELATALIYNGPTRFQTALWPMGNPIHRSFDDCQLASRRRGESGQEFASTLRNANQDDDYYRHRRPQDILYPFDHSIRAYFFYFQYQHLDDWEDDYNDFLDIIETLKQRKNAEQAHRKRHQKRGKKRKAKNKAAAPPIDQPGHFAKYEDTEFDEEMDCC